MRKSLSVTYDMFSVSVGSCAVSSPSDNFVFDTNTQYQREFIDMVKKDGTDSALEWLKGVQGDNELSYPQSLELKWKGNKSNYTVEISETDSFLDALSFNSNGNTLTVDNLKTNTLYFWRVNGENVHSFKTEKGVRFIRMEGARNVRDLGGDKIKQGVLFRGSQLNDYHALNKDGKNVFCNLLKIKTELDLRGEVTGIETSLTGDEVKYVNLPYRPYKEAFEEQHKEGLVKIFDFLADENNYPIYFHCAGGADRTGMIAIYLRALVGENEEDILLDYELTSLSRFPENISTTIDMFRSRTYDYFKEFYDALYDYSSSENFNERVKAFLSDCGIKEDTMAKIIEIIKAK